MLVLNEPETSLHPDLLPALAEERDLEFRSIELSKDFGQTVIEGQGPLGGPAWRWPSR